MYDIQDYERAMAKIIEEATKVRSQYPEWGPSEFKQALICHPSCHGVIQVPQYEPP